MKIPKDQEALWMQILDLREGQELRIRDLDIAGYRSTIRKLQRARSALEAQGYIQGFRVVWNMESSGGRYDIVIKKEQPMKIEVVTVDQETLKVKKEEV